MLDFFGNRVSKIGLEGFCSTIELHPRRRNACLIQDTTFAQPAKTS